MDRVDAVVVGAGVVGLAVARALGISGLEVVVIDAAPAIGTGLSSRNSEVIHAGLYDRHDSLKARLCVRGKQLLYAYCEARAVAHRRCGKLLVATDAREAARLGSIASRARRNGVDDLQFLSRHEARELEPELDVMAALWSPSSGIVDSHGLMMALRADAEAHGVGVALASPMIRAERGPGGWRLQTGGDEPFEMASDWLVNCAGLQAQRIASMMAGFPHAFIPQRHLAKGHYFSLARRAPFSRLIYPTPVDGGLGVHLTLDLGGQARFGPDVEWLTGSAADEPLDHAVDANRAGAFEASIRRYWPGLSAGLLQPAYSGIRPKLSGPGEPPADFRIDGPGQHGVAGVVQLFGIESPGLTASMAIAEHVANIVTIGA